MGSILLLKLKMFNVSNLTFSMMFQKVIEQGIKLRKKVGCFHVNYSGFVF